LPKPRFRKLDEQSRGDHSHLCPEDDCYFLYEYTSQQNYSFSATNSLISNLKKKPSQAHVRGYGYKARAIRQCASELSSAINPRWLKGATLVPVPPSKAHSHPDYDDRVVAICRSIRAGQAMGDVRELVIQRISMPAAHEGARPTVSDLLDVYEIDEVFANPAPTRIGVVDDVLTVGAHFVAMKTILQRRFRGVPVVGFFIARRVFANPFDELLA